MNLRIRMRSSTIYIIPVHLGTWYWSLLSYQRWHCLIHVAQWLSQRRHIVDLNSTHGSFFSTWDTQCSWLTWILFNCTNSWTKPIWLIKDHQWRQLIMFLSSVKRGMFLQFLNAVANRVNYSMTTTWLKSLTWLTRCWRILSIYSTSRHQISKALNYTSEIMFTVFNFDGPLITAPTDSISVAATVKAVKRKTKAFHSSAQCRRRSTRVATIELETRWGQGCKYWQQQQRSLWKQQLNFWARWEALLP